MVSRPEERTVEVLIVDDSAVVRKVMSSILSRQPGLAVRAAADPLIAQRKMREKRPDVLLLDLEMPRMDGLTFLRMIMREDPLPVVVCSGHTARGSEEAIRALEYGAVEVLEKPQVGISEFLRESAVLLSDAVRGAALSRGPASSQSSTRTEMRWDDRWDATALHGAETVVAVGASTGGPQALREILRALPSSFPPLLVVQHMPAPFTAAFAKRLDRECLIEVLEARDGDPVVAGRALIAPGNRHLELCRKGSGFRVTVRDGALVSRHRPSVDVLFRSVAEAAGRNAVGMVLTGMGSDGANGLLRMRQAGAVTVAQDEASSVVFGMPREAISRGAAEWVVSLGDLAPFLLRSAR